MSHALPYPAQKDSPTVHPQVALRDSLPQGGLLAPDFLASLGNMNPQVSPTSRTAQDIASYLNGAASSVNQTNQAYSAPAQTFLSQQALIQALLASAKQTMPNPSPFGQPSFLSTLNQHNTSMGGAQSSSQPPLWTQESSSGPSSSFNLAQYQAYLDFHALRFSPSYNNNLVNYNNQQQFNPQFNQQHQQQYGQSSAPVYPALPFLSNGGDDRATPNLTSSSASSHSTAESPSLPELGQDFIYDPAFDLSGGANDFGDTSPYLQPANLHSTPFEYTKDPTFNLAQQQHQQQQAYYQQALAHQQQQQASFGPDSPLTTSPSSVNSAASPYAFNQLADSSSFSNSGSEYEFHSAAAPRHAPASSSSSTASVGSHNGEGEPEKKKHVCDVCHRAFARAFNLKSHMHTHAPQRFKPFNCPAVGCSRSFSRSHDMERHRSGIHQEGPLAAKAGLIPEDSPAAAPGVKASAKKRSSATGAVRGVSNA